jgi:hypothetical protein
MRKIELKNIEKPTRAAPMVWQNLYKIHLGDGRFVCFRNKKNADAALVKLNQELNNILFELRRLSASVNSVAFDLWPYLPAQMLQDLNQASSDRNHQFIKLCKPVGPNYGHFVNNWLRSLCGSIASDADALAIVARKKLLYPTEQKARRDASAAVDLLHRLNELATIIGGDVTLGNLIHDISH